MPHICPPGQLSRRLAFPQTNPMRPRILNLLLLCFALAACKSGSSTSTTPPTQPPPSNSTISVTVSPSTASIRAGSSAPFTSTVTGSSNTAVTWSVNGTPGGSNILGLISSTGSYAAPGAPPTPNTISITATSSADSTKSATSSVTLLNPIPILTGISPSATSLGSFTLTVTGSGFINGAQVLLNGLPLSTAFEASTRLIATGSANAPGTFSIEVQNPDPGSSNSASVNFQVNGSSQASSSCSQMSVGQGASLNGFLPFPSDNLWNQNISASPVDPNSAAYINYIGTSVGLHADFGSGEYQGSTIGIPYTIVDGSQPLIPINYQAYGSESDPGPMPIALTDPIEGYPNPGTGDRHVLVLDNANCFLYELYSSYPQSTVWNADSGAVWDLLSDEQRPYTWTSADAAGLPIFPGLVRYDEVAAGVIKHAIRFTLQNSSAGFVPPASHFASTTSNANALPMGARLRLKSSFDISSFSGANQIILTAMKNYGLILADNGSSMYLSGAPNDNWSNDDLHNLGSVTTGNFEVIQLTPLYTANNVPSGPAPTISSFTASANSVSAGTAVTLSWQTTNAGYVIVSPNVGATRATSATVSPSVTTTYTLYAANAYNQSTASVTITVH
jgi:hypothetical protein